MHYVILLFYYKIMLTEMIFMRHPDPIDIHNIVSVDAAGSPDWAFPLHAHPHHLEISLVLSGGGLLYFGGRSYVMKKGDLSIKNAGVVHAEHTDPRDPIRQICITFSGVDEMDGCPGHLLAENASPILPCEGDMDLMSAMFRYLALHWREEESAAVCRELTLAALDLICMRISRTPADRRPSKADPRIMQTVSAVTAWINEHYPEKITLNGLAERFFVSPYYLEKKFKESTGFSINQYVIDRRMGEAQRLLIFDQAGIKEIALAVGYENLQYFYATFRKYTGVTPLDFRMRFRRE